MFSNGLIFTHSCIFRRILADISETVRLDVKIPGKVAWTIIPSNFPVELQLKFVLWDPLGPPRGVPRGVPEGPRGSQRRN